MSRTPPLAPQGARKRNWLFKHTGFADAQIRDNRSAFFLKLAGQRVLKFQRPFLANRLCRRSQAFFRLAGFLQDNEHTSLFSARSFSQASQACSLCTVVLQLTKLCRLSEHFGQASPLEKKLLGCRMPCFPPLEKNPGYLANSGPKNKGYPAQAAGYPVFLFLKTEKSRIPCKFTGYPPLGGEKTKGIQPRLLDTLFSCFRRRRPGLIGNVLCRRSSAFPTRGDVAQGSSSTSLGRIA